MMKFMNKTVFNCLGAHEPDLYVIEIGNDSGGSGVVISSRSRIAIGEYVKLGGNVRIYDHDFHSLDQMRYIEGTISFGTHQETAHPLLRAAEHSFPLYR